MTDTGKAFVIARLSDCQDLAALRHVWESLGVEYQQCPEIQAHKDVLKKAMETRA